MRAHALSMEAIPGGPATHDQIDSPNRAALRRGGMRPQPSVSPAERRDTRDLRRCHTMLPPPWSWCQLCPRVAKSPASCGSTTSTPVSASHGDRRLSSGRLGHRPAGPNSWTRVEPTPGQGTAVTILAPQLARAASDRLKRNTAGARDTFRQAYGSSAGAPDVSWATPGISLSHACARSCWTASRRAKVRLGFFPQRPGR